MSRLEDSVTVTCSVEGRQRGVLDTESLSFVARLHRQFAATRDALLEARAARQRRLDDGDDDALLPPVPGVRDLEWTVAPPPPALSDRRVEITGPTDRRMMIHALNSGARVFMADLEDASAPTWTNMLEGQVNLRDAVERTLSSRAPDGRLHVLDAQTAALAVRPRGLHLEERHVLIDGRRVAATLFDIGLFVWNNARRLVDQGDVPHIYIPKLESAAEARLWGDVLAASEDSLSLTPGSIRVTALIETLPAAFEMDEILYELRDRACGLNAGRWDYLFSTIKTFRSRGDFVLPDRNTVTMEAPFLRAYALLLTKTCHRRGAHAIGGMAAFVPNRREPDATARAIDRVRRDKRREASDGMDGTWVAHPDLVPIARAVFDAQLGEEPNQLGRQLHHIKIDPKQLIEFTTDGHCTYAGMENNVDVSARYLNAWLQGRGAISLHNLMEDAATAEIARAQLWQWIQAGVTLLEGDRVTRSHVRDLIEHSVGVLAAESVGDPTASGRLQQVQRILERGVLHDDLPPFLTTLAYDELS